MKKCLWDEYICMLEDEIVKCVEHEVHCHLSSRGEAYMHHLMENLKHAKMMMDKMDMPHAAMPNNPEKSSYFGG